MPTHESPPAHAQTQARLLGPTPPASHPARGWVLVLVSALLVVTACDPGASNEELRRLHAQGRHAAMLEPLRERLDADPDDPELNYLYGVALNRTQSGRLSVWSLRKAAEHPAWATRARIELAGAAIQVSNWTEAIEETSKILEADPDQTTARMLRGTALLEEGKEIAGALEDFEMILDLEPENASAMASRARALLLLGETEEAEEAIRRLQAKSQDEETPGAQALMCTTGAVLAAEKSAPDAGERFEACLEAHPNDPVLVEQAVRYFDGIGERKRATEILAALHEALPGAQSYRQALAARAISDGDEAKAEAILRAGTERPDPRTRSTAWIDLTNFYLERDRLAEAIDAYEEALALNDAPSQLAILQHADLLARAERHEKALAVASRLEQDAYRGLIEARVHLNEGRPAEALARLDEVFPSWPNNPGARYYAARAAEQLGQFERAIEEYRQSIRSGPEQTDAGLRLAKLYLEAGALQNAWNSAAQHFRAHPEDPEGVRVLLRAASVAAPASVQQLFQRLRGTPLWPTALAIRAERVETAQGPAAALASIDESEGEVPDLTLPINAELFRTRTRLLIALGRVDEARKGVDAALAAHPETAAFHEIHGLVLEAELASGSGKATPESIREAHARAVELDPEGSHALESLGRRNEADGNLDAALALYERAALAALERISPRQAAAEALLRAGRADEAEAVWEEQLEEHPWDAASAQGLVQLRLGRGVTDDRTLELAERAVLFRGGPAARELLLTVHRQRGEQDRADQLAEAFEAGRPLPPSRITPIEGL